MNPKMTTSTVIALAVSIFLSVLFLTEGVRAHRLGSFTEPHSTVALQPVAQGGSAARDFPAASEVAGGLNTTVFNTPHGKVRVNLPDDMAAGDTLTGTVVAEPAGKDDKERAKNEGELSGYVVELEKQTFSSPSLSGSAFKLAMPAAISKTHLILKNKKGEEIARREIPVAQQPRPEPAFDLPAFSQQGRPFEIRGPFDGDFSTTGIRLGGEDLKVLAESPRKVVARNTIGQVGRSELEIREQGQVVKGECNTLGISLSAPKLDLLRGEQTTLLVTVTGLEGIKESVPLLLENKSPGVIQMGGGEVQPLSISPAQVQGGSYTTERPLTGIQRGSFTITGTVMRTSDPRQTQTREPLRSQTRADLSITKTAATEVRNGERYITYTITITNNGPNGAENVVVMDNLPPELTFASCTATSPQRDERGAGGVGDCGGSGNSRTITFPFLAINASATITIVVKVNDSVAPGTFITNVANVGALTSDSNLTNNTAEVTTAIPTEQLTSIPRSRPSPSPSPSPTPSTAADLKITKTAMHRAVKPGDRITYKLVITNSGPDTAVAPLVIDSIPSETTFVSCTATGGGVCTFGVAAGGLVDVTLPDMPRGAMETVTVEVDVKKTIGAGTAIINDTEVSSGTLDLNLTNNKAWDVVWVHAPVPLVVISEFRTRGPNGAQDEFIELYNRSNQRLDLSGWKIMVSDGSGATTTLLTIKPGTLLPARRYLLLTNSDGYKGSVGGDQTFVGDIANDGGIALMPLRGIPGDQVGMSIRSAYREGAVLSPLMTDVNQSYERKPGGARGSTQDLNINRNDFQLLAPSNPQNLAGQPISWLRFSVPDNARHRVLDMK